MNIQDITDTLFDERSNARRSYEYYKEQQELTHRVYVMYQQLQEKIRQKNLLVHSIEYPNKKIDIETYLTKEMKDIIDYILHRLEMTKEYIGCEYNNFQCDIRLITEMFTFLTSSNKIDDKDKIEFSKAAKYLSNMLPFFKEYLK